MTNPGTIEVDPTASGAILALDDGTTITNGTLTIGSGSTLDVELAGTASNNPDATLDGVTVTGVDAVTIDSPTPASTIEVGVTTAATLLLDDGTTIATGALTSGSGSTLDIEAGPNTGAGATLDGVAVTDNGAIDIGTQDSSATLQIADAVTLTGTGTLTLENSGDTLSGASATPGSLENSGTIAGVGSIDNSVGSLTLTNEAGGVIDADGGGGATLTLNTGNNIVNAGLIEATNGGDLIIDDSVINSSQGSVVADGGTVTVGSSGAVGGAGTIRNHRRRDHRSSQQRLHLKT